MGKSVLISKKSSRKELSRITKSFSPEDKARFMSSMESNIQNKAHRKKILEEAAAFGGTTEGLNVRLQAEQEARKQRRIDRKGDLARADELHAESERRTAEGRLAREQEGEAIRLGGEEESAPIRLGGEGEAEEDKSLFGQAQEQFERVQEGESFLGDFWGAKLLADPRTSLVLLDILSLLSIKKMISGTTVLGKGGAKGASKRAADKAAALVKTPGSKLEKPISDVFRLGSKQGTKTGFPEFVLPKGADIKHLKPFTQNLNKAQKLLKTLTPAGLKKLWTNPYVKFGAGVASVDVIMTWLASDNIVDGINFQLNSVAKQVEKGTITKEEAGAIIAQLAEYQSYAGNFAAISATVNPLLMPFKRLISANVEANALEFDSIITRIDGAETPEEKEAREEEEQLEFEETSLDLAKEKSRIFEESQTRQNEAELELAKEKNRLFAISRDEERQKELAQRIEESEYFKNLAKGKTSTQKSSLSFGLLNTILTLLIDTKGGE